MASGLLTMSEADRKFLKENTELLKKELQIDSVLPLMYNTLRQEDEDVINAELIPQKKTTKLLVMLPKRGADAFNAFLIAVNRVQPWLAKHLADKRGIALQDIVPAENQGPGMLPVHREILRRYLPLFEEKLDIETIVKHLSETNIISMHLTTAIQQEQTRKAQVKKFITNVLPKSGPEAFLAFYKALTKLQPGFAHEFKQQIDVSHPNVTLISCQESVAHENSTIEEYDVSDGLARMAVQDTQRKKAIRIIKDIPQNLRIQFIQRLNPVKTEILSRIATEILEMRCYVRDTADFLEKIGDKKTRILFRELRKEKQDDVTKWMRNNFPAGSTGPVKSDDEKRCGDMNYGRRQDVTKRLNTKDLWKRLASHPDIDMPKIDVDLLEQSHKDPADAVLCHWEVSCKSTVGTMYDLLVDCGFTEIADYL